jgi:hypothetical protein
MKTTLYGSVIAAATLAMLTATSAPALAASCKYYQVSRGGHTAAYVRCSGYLDTGWIRVTVWQCSSRGCSAASGPWIHKASNDKSEVYVGRGYWLKKRGSGMQFRSP